MAADTQTQLDTTTPSPLSAEAKALTLLHGGKPSPEELSSYQTAVRDDKNWNSAYQRDLVEFTDMVNVDVEEAASTATSVRESPWLKANSVTDDNILKRFNAQMDSLVNGLLKKAQQGVLPDPSWDPTTQQIYEQMVAKLKSDTAAEIVKQHTKTDLINSFSSTHGFTMESLTPKLDRILGKKVESTALPLPTAQPK